MVYRCWEKKTKRFEIRLSASEKEALAEIAQKKHPCTIASLVHEAIGNLIESSQKKPKR